MLCTEYRCDCSNFYCKHVITGDTGNPNQEDKGEVSWAANLHIVLCLATKEYGWGRNKIIE